MTNDSACGVRETDGRDCEVPVEPGSPFNVCPLHYRLIHDCVASGQAGLDAVARLHLPCPACGVRALLASLLDKVARCGSCDHQLDADEARRLNAALEPPKPAPPRATPVVYYLRVGQLIKIGFTSDLQQRLRAYPPDTTVLATEPGGMDLEQQRHREFSATRVAGREWFDPSASLIRHINGLREQPLTAADMAA